MNKRNHGHMTIADRDKCTKIAKDIKKYLEIIDKHEFAMMFVRGYWYYVDEGNEQSADDYLSSFIANKSCALFWDVLYLILQEYHNRQLIMPAKLADWNVKNLDKKRKLPREVAFNTIRNSGIYNAVKECIAQDYKPIYSVNEMSICEGVALAWPKESGKDKDKGKVKTLGRRTVYNEWKTIQTLAYGN